MQVSEAAGRTEWIQSQRLVRRKPELRLRPSEVRLSEASPHPPPRSLPGFCSPKVCYHVSAGTHLSPSSSRGWGAQGSDGTS